MTDGDDPVQGDGEILRRRLEETASGELSYERLRRRYDDLRRDYVSLMQRLADLEERAVAPSRAPVAAAAPSFGVRDAMLTPLLALRDEYADALTGLREVVSAIDGATERIRGQRARPQHAPAEPAPPAEQQVQVDVRGRSPGEMLAFREQLAGLAGVRAVHVHAMDRERTTLIVELGSQIQTG